MYKWFLNALIYCEEVYGSETIINEDTGEIEGFICPHCGEPIYFDDWDGSFETENWMICPICGEEWCDE